ncbi:MAG: TrkH family potassium uptake protein [Bacteroidaceae bacterium]|nr:TrkH family potassium uptake protein [Bacteroidaceae bacterium]
MLHLKTIVRILGMLLLLEAIFMLLVLCSSIYFADGMLVSFVLSIALSVLLGGIMVYLGRDADNKVSIKDGYLIVALCWVVYSIFGSLPYMLSGHITNMADAFFETMSGFTTTGNTIMINPESYPKSLLLWRAMTQWIGGLGIVFFTIALLPIFGLGDINLFSAESVGISRGKLHPRITVTARWVLTIYTTLTIMCIGSLYLAGMGLFDSVCHSLSTLSTGGFSTRQASIGAYGSPLIEYIIAIYMFLGGTNFSLLYITIFKQKFGALFKDGEFITYVKLVGVFTIIIAIGLFVTDGKGVEESFRLSLFQVLSVMTTTGFGTSNYLSWSPILWFLLSLTMFFGGCSGSTTGAMKCIRIGILAKTMKNEFRRILHPNAVLAVKMGGERVPGKVQSAVLAFTVIYMLAVLAGIVVGMFFDMSFVNSYGISISCVGNVGASIGDFGPIDNYAALPDILKWFYSFLMLVGRLEFFAVLLLFTPVFWERS